MGAILKELHNSASKFQFPSMPKDDVDVKRETAYQEYNILGKGKMSYPSGMGTQIIKWSGYFWGAGRKKLASVNQKWIAPKTCASKLKNWQTKKTPLNLVVSEAGINEDVTIKSFEYKPFGGHGDYSYEISFVPYGDMKIYTTKELGIEKKAKKKKIGTYILFAAITIFFLVLVLSLNDISAIFNQLKTIDPINLLIAFAFLLVYAILTPATLCILCRSEKVCASWKEIYVIGMTEHFFNGITPFATGGQPFQVYSLNKLKVPPSKSTGILMMNFIITMIVTNAYAACSLMYYEKFISTAQNLQSIAIIGFTMNFLVLLFIIALGTSKKLCSCLIKIFKWLANLKFLKKFLEPKIPSFISYCENAQIAFKEIIHHKSSFIFCIIVKVIAMFFYYAMTFYILRSLHIDVGYDLFFTIICGTSFAVTAVVFLPTPGSSGGIEFAFSIIFTAFISMSDATANAGMLIWRLLSYYLMMIISLGFYIGFEIYLKHKKIPEIETKTTKIENTPNIEFVAKKDDHNE